MITVNFCRAPSHYWVGWCVYENGTYYASGTTLDKMLYCIKRRLWTDKKISVRGVILASKQSDPSEAPISVFKSMFLTKYWYPKGDDVVRTTPKTSAPVETVKEQTYDYYDTLTTGDELIVYGILRKEVARYKLNPNKMALPTSAPTQLPKITPFGSPQQPFEPQVRYDTCINNAVDDTPNATAKWKPRPDIPTE